MKTTLLYLIVFFSTLFSCNSQEVNNKSNKDEKIKPHEKVTVNRKYDKNGNLIEFDSTYTAYYSNLKGDTIQLDSILNEFPRFFSEGFSNLNSNAFLEPFSAEDSILYSQFFHNNYFEKQFLEQNEDMLKMFQRMDSIKNSFFEQYWTTKK